MTRQDLPWWREPTRAQWLSFGAAWLGWVLDAFDFTVFLLVMPQIEREFGVHHVATTVSIALTLTARLVGSFIAGAAADRWGRKLPLMISLAWFAVCDAAVAFAPTFGWVLILRTLFGVGMGAEWTAGTTLAMESWPARSKGIASGVLQGSWAIGYLLAAAASAVVLPVWGWRGLFILAAAPALMVVPMRAFVSESEDWKSARATAPISTIHALKKPGTVATLTWASLSMGVGFGAYYALTSLYPTLLASELHLGEGRVAGMIVLFNLGMLAGSIGCGVIASRFGARAAIVTPAILFLPCAPLYVGASSTLLPLGAFLGGALGAGFCGVVPMLLTDLFDADVRARFTGLVYHVGAVLAAMVPIIAAGIARWRHTSLATSIAIVSVVCEAALALLVLSRARRSSAPVHVVARALESA